jgi:hypothetical protein
MTIRPLLLSVGVGFLAAACSMHGDQAAAPATFRTPVEAVARVCADPPSHIAITKAVQSLGWDVLAENQIPTQVIGNGAVTWTHVVEAPDRAMLVAAGRLGGTSFCRVYARERPSSPLQVSIEQIVVFGRVLGAPDFRKRIEDKNVLGWHTVGRPDWRAVHLSVATPSENHGDQMPIMIEMTRALT